MMDKQTIRAFATGLFLASILLFGYQLVKADPANSKNSGTISQIMGLKKSVQYWHDKYAKLLQQKTAVTSSKELNRYHLTISSGMNPGIIAERLKTGKIIPDAKALEQYLIDHNDESKIQLGEYDLTNQMSVPQIANAITKNK
jgi:cell division protein YceG involved in septum cleavage